MNNLNGIKLAWFINGSEGFGISSITVAMAKELRSSGTKISFIAAQRGSLYSIIEANGFSIQCLDVTVNAYYKGSSRQLLKSLIKIYKQDRRIKHGLEKIIHQEYFDCIILGYANMLLPFSMAKTKYKRTTKYFLMHNVISDNYFLSLNKLLYQISCRLFRIKIIANSHYTASTIKGFGIRPYVLHLGIDESRFSEVNLRPQKRASFNIGSNDLVFGVFARFGYDKGQHLVIEGFSKLVYENENLPLKLLLIGADKKDGYYKNCIKRIIDNQLEEKIIIVDKVSDIQNYYALADVIINSRTDPEPFGLTVIEAMYMKKPVIAFHLGGPSETILEDETGWLVEFSSEEGYYDAMKKAIRNKDRWEKVGNSGHAQVKENFTTPTIAQKLYNIIARSNEK